MKKSITILTVMFVTLFAASLVSVSCSSKKAEQSEGTGHQHSEDDSTSREETMPMDSTQTAYACPMHPDITGKESDKCSKCGMKLEAKASEHKH
jgi:hypothetical protein